MEIIKDGGKKSVPVTRGKNVFIGVILIAAGLLWLARNFDLVPRCVFTALFSWQTLLMILGGYLLAVRKFAAGTFFIVIGILFVVTQWFDIYEPVSKLILPVVVIAAGISVLSQSNK